MKTIAFRFSFLIMTMLLASASWSQSSLGSISGKITDKETGAALAEVFVIINDGKYERRTKTDQKGLYEIKNVRPGTYKLTVSLIDYDNLVKSGIQVKAGQQRKLNFQIIKANSVLPKEIKDIEEVDAEYDHAPISNSDAIMGGTVRSKKMSSNWTGGSVARTEAPYHNTESYNAIEENGYKLTTTSPLSTFSVDVDAASYSNVRRFLTQGQKPDKGAVRVEEMINYFDYDYPNPTDEHPFSITTEIGDCPWNKNKLVHIGLQGERIDKTDLPASNLVFLLDVSGSMNSPNKLPLLKKSFRMLVNELSERDRIAIVVYAGAAGVVLNSTTADHNSQILEALEKLSAGGSTAGGAGIELAYKVAQENFIDGGNNRVILATDGDFNIGMSSDASMKQLIEKKRETGIFLTCLGFGTGNLKDSKMETLADAGNGNYAYIDNVFEAKKVLVTEIGATLVTLAKDVKIQVEFNPAVVESYRLVGYENRLLNAEDFNDDKKDAGEIGAGHSVTALYEVVLKGEGGTVTTPSVDPLRYQDKDGKPTRLNELLTVKFRYKEPDGSKSKLLERHLKNEITRWEKLSDNYKFSAAVAGFGMLLRESEYAGDMLFDKVIELAEQGIGDDKNGYRAEFIKLVDAAKMVY